MTKFNHLRPILWTENMAESVAFYTEILGFVLDEYSEEWNWASLSKDLVGIMLTKPNAHTKVEKTGFSGSFYFNVNNVDELWEHLKSKARICYEPEDFPWEMREFAVYDNNGYILQFGQNL